MSLHGTPITLEDLADTIKRLRSSADANVQAMLDQYNADDLRAEAQHLANGMYAEAERCTAVAATLASTAPAVRLRAAE